MTDNEAKDIVGGVLQAVETLRIEVDDKIDNFIVDQVNMITNQHYITVNAQMIADACLKQTPKKPKETVQITKDEFTFACCNCGRATSIFHDLKIEYCPHCGQAIDWTKEESNDKS